MGIYTKSQEMLDRVINEMTVLKELVDKKDESKAEKYGFVPGMNMKNETALLEDQIHKLREGIFQVLFTGGFNSGKSTLLNALMRGDPLRTSIKAETAVLTKIVFGAEEKVIVYKKTTDPATGKQLSTEMTIKDFFEIYRVSQDEPEKFMEIDYVQLQQPQDGIGGKMVQFVDSPGTENSEADTKTAREFADKASAIVYVVNAIKAFEYDEKKYIADHFANKENKNLFFVINHYDQVSEDQLSNLAELVEKQLRDVYKKPDGSFDRELFESRVFYTNAYGSMNTRMNKETPIARGRTEMIPDEETGVPGFEEALGCYLTDSDRDRDALRAYIPRLVKVYADAHKKADREINAYKKDVAQLYEEKAEVERKAETTRNIIKGIEDCCEITACNMINRIGKAYDMYVKSVDDDWDDYFTQNPIPIKPSDVLNSALARNPEIKASYLRPLDESMRKYLDEKTNEFSTVTVPEIIEEESGSFRNTLAKYEEQLKAIDSPVSIGEVLEKIRANTQLEINSSSGVKVNYFQFALALFTFDIGTLTNTVTNRDSNTVATARALGWNMLEYVMLDVFWPIYLVRLGVNLARLVRGDAQLGLKITQECKATTVKELKKRKARVKMEIEKDITTGFVGAGKEFTANLYNQLDEEIESSVQIMINVNDQNFSIDAEKERTSMLLSRVAQAISNINLAVNGEELSVSEIKALAGLKEEAPEPEFTEAGWLKLDTEIYGKQYEKMVDGENI